MLEPSTGLNHQFDLTQTAVWVTKSNSPSIVDKATNPQDLKTSDESEIDVMELETRIHEWMSRTQGCPSSRMKEWVDAC